MDNQSKPDDETTPSPEGPRKRKKPKRDLTRAVALRPRDVFDLYGIPSSTLCGLCKHEDPAKRLPSKLIPGRKGRKGVRLLLRTDVEAYINRFGG